MKRFLLTLCLFLTALVLIPTSLKAESVYLLTGQTINGVTGTYDEPSAHEFTESSTSGVYTYKITSMPEGGFYFRIGVEGWTNNMQPYSDDTELSINGDSYTITNDCYGNSKAWKVSYTSGEYTSLTIEVCLTEGSRYVKITGSTATEGGSTSSSVRDGYYLVGNFFNTDNSSTISYDKCYFKFEMQSDGSYKADIPATLTANVQILGVSGFTQTVYGPGEAGYGLHGASINGNAYPATNGSCSGSLTANSILALNNNYWSFSTRNDGKTDDDGIYEVSFTLTEGVPSTWTITHNALKRIYYFLSNASGATAQAAYDVRNGTTSTFSHNTYTTLYIDPAQTYYVIGNTLHDAESESYSLASAYGAQSNTLNSSILPTTNKLFLLGNGGREYKSSNPYNEVSPNEDPIAPTTTKAATYTVAYNPSNGNTEDARNTGNYSDATNHNHLGIRGQFSLLSGGTNEPLQNVSVVGPAIDGTTVTTADNTTWEWDSSVGEMSYDENENCYKLTLTTSGAAGKHFRFVANHSQSANWYETNTTARIPYTDSDESGKTSAATVEDPNDVAYTVTGTKDYTASSYDILFNRPAGTWTIRFYINIDNNGNKTYAYTITASDTIPVNLTYRDGKFLRTWCYPSALDLPADGTVRAYEAYKFVEGKESDDKQGTVYLRRLEYIPANMGVVLVGSVDADRTYTDGSAKGFKLTVRTADAATDAADYPSVWTLADSYSGDAWNNYLMGTLEQTSIGNCATDENGKITYRYFGMKNYANTKTGKANGVEAGSDDDYIGFFRLTSEGVSYAYKAYLSLPADNTTDPGKTYGALTFNGNFLYDTTDSGDTPQLAKTSVVFDDATTDASSTTGITDVESTVSSTDNQDYYNLSGMKVTPLERGIYIHNRMKIIIK